MATRTIDEAIELVRGDDSTKFDVHTQAQHIGFESRPNRDEAAMLIDTPNGTLDTQFTDWSRSQMMNKLGIPIRYWERMTPEMQATNGNYWLQRDWDAKQGVNIPRARTEPFLLRARQPQLEGKPSSVRGVLSGKYTILNNSELMEALYAILQQSNYRVEYPGRQCLLSDKVFFIRVLFPDLTREIKPGRKASLGVCIGNSEVGSRRVTIQAFLYDWFCTNGLVAVAEYLAAYERRHIGISRNELISNMNYSFANAMKGGAQYMDMVEQATKVSFDEPEKTLKELLETGGYGESLQTQALQFWHQDELSPRDNSIYGIIGAMTRTAQVLDVERRLALEEYAGSLVPALLDAA